MSGVNFRYRPNLPLVLSGISVDIGGGMKVSMRSLSPSGGHRGQDRRRQVLAHLHTAPTGGARGRHHHRGWGRSSLGTQQAQTKLALGLGEHQ